MTVERSSGHAASTRLTSFMRRLIAHPCVLEALLTGGHRRRSTQPYVKDLDLIVVLRRDYPREQAVRLIQQIVCFGALGRSLDDRHRYRSTRVTGYSLQYEARDDAVDPQERFYLSPPPVDVMPAYREGTHLMIPDRDSDQWIPANPDYADLKPLVTAWSRRHDLGLTPLAAQTMALRYLPRGRTDGVDVALAAFFRNAAENALSTEDPLVRVCLRETADVAERAVVTDRLGDRWDAERLWHDVLGERFGPNWMSGVPVAIPIRPSKTDEMLTAASKWRARKSLGRASIRSAFG
ncbi:hypothetical protein [Kineosporia babensis]|uniref:Nucleotidyltransferase n=1 Tax=Kineosporia babensis TaxID=499548 RepID=A0A9X1SV53_9ACTN|nr:hypothetical protein [Kineosporia babensis]MCD5313241.1 hypothetical protein [Kineosporia babensis]